MKIIAHRGASGLALENTLAAFELARLLGVDAIELDIRKTADNVLIACHDPSLSRVSESELSIHRSKLKQLQSVRLNDNDSRVPTLKQVFEVTGTIPLIVEMKTSDCVEELADFLQGYSGRDVTVVSFRHEDLRALKARAVHAKFVGLERTNPFEIVDKAKQLGLDGIGLNFWLLNPLTYWWIKRGGLSIYVYTINSRLLGDFISWLYPNVGICTDHPEWFIKHPWLKLKRSFTEKHRKKGH